MGTSVGLSVRVLLAAVAIHAVGGVFVRPVNDYDWDWPCTYLRSTGSTLKSPQGRMRDHYFLMSDRAIEAKGKIDALMNKYEVERFGNNGRPNMLDYFQLPGLLVLNFTTDSDLHITRMLQNFYQQLSHVAVFLQEAHQDEKAQEDEGGYSQDFQKLEEYTYWLLCQNWRAMDARSYRFNTPEYNRVVTPAVMRDDIRNMDGAMGHYRDYVVIREYGKVLDYIGPIFKIVGEKCKQNEWLLKEWHVQA